MTAFTYRFAPAMRYLKHLVVERRAGRAAAFSQPAISGLARDELGLAAISAQLAGAGDLFDMTIHRIDFAIDLLGPLDAGLRCAGAVRSAHRDGRRRSVRPLGRRRLVEHDRRIRQRRHRRLGRDHAGQRLSPRRIRPRVGRNQRLRRLGRLSAARAAIRCCWARRARIWRRSTCRREFLKPADSPRDPAQGEPATVFRYDLVWEFVSAIVGRPAGRAQFLRRAEGADGGRRRDRVASVATLGRDYPRTSLTNFSADTFLPRETFAAKRRSQLSGSWPNKQSGAARRGCNP